ncbi:MAG: class I SAM-dependent methyltransferase [Candidatus Diapherotrites archaeon]|nr:class I SAM-dependent methyltransferase [Candidatus Diapherotrites archaeon]
MRRNDCRLCKSKDLQMFLQLGPQPLAGKFLKPEQLNETEEFYALDVFFCKNCKLVQVLDIVPKETLFSEYFYAPHTLLSKHFTSYANEIVKEFNLNEKSLVVEIGSNIGMMLKPFKELGVPAVGVEPAQNIAAMANELGLETVNDFFNEKVAKEIVRQKGKADLIIANNVFAHIDNLDEILLGVKALLKPNGVFVFENHYLLDTLEKVQYDDVYHEHLCYYSLLPIIPFFQKYGMTVFDAKKINTHGGSIRVYCSNSAKLILPSIKQLLDAEKKAGLDILETFVAFGKKVQNNKIEVYQLLHSLKSQGKSIIGYGAPARGNTLLNYCKIDSGLLDYIIDDSPLRQGKYTPGTHIPIVSVDQFRSQQPDYAFLLAWGGYTESILQKEQKFIEKGGKFIIPLPETKIVP